MKNLRHPLSRLLTAFGLMTLACICSCLSVRPVYKDKERAIAEKAVSRFHELYNDQNVDGMYDLMEETVRSKEPKPRTQEAMKKTMESTGRVQSTGLIQANISPGALPGYSSRVNMSYATQFERGEATEIFTWDIKNGEAQLFEYKTAPRE